MHIGVGITFARKIKFREDTEETEPSPSDCRSLRNAFLSNGSLYIYQVDY